MTEIRHYPTSCLSMYCGEIHCPDDCKFKPALDEFNSWKEKTKAIPADPIWSPGIYVSTVSSSGRSVRG